MNNYKILNEENDKTTYQEAGSFSLEELGLLGNKTRQRIVRALASGPLYPMEIAKKLRIHEQLVYYHLRTLINAKITKVIGTKDIRGTTAKRYSLTNKCFVSFLKEEWKPYNRVENGIAYDEFFQPFIKDGCLNARIVVGSPDPHGPHKARARDGHYAIDLGLYLGSISSLPEDFSVGLDVDISLKGPDNLIIVGGPVTNLLCAEVNKNLPKRFSDQRPWGIKGNRLHSEDNIGIIAKVPNPYEPSLSILLIAGIRFSGTKAAVIGLTRNTRLVLTRFTGQKKFTAIVQGFDLDADGRIDSIELLE